MSLFDGLGDFFRDAGALAKDALGAWGEIDAVLNPEDYVYTNTGTQTTAYPSQAAAQPEVNLNVTASDLFAMPNMPLLIGGAVLLIILLTLKK